MIKTKSSSKAENKAESQKQSVTVFILTSETSFNDFTSLTQTLNYGDAEAVYSITASASTLTYIIRKLK